MRRYTLNTKGMSYLEVIMGTVILGLMVPPILAWMLQGVKMREEIKTTHQVTLQAQNMLQTIKQTLDKHAGQIENLIRENDGQILDLQDFLIESPEQLQSMYQTKRYIYELGVLSDIGEVYLSTATPGQLIDYTYQAKQVIADEEVGINIEKASLLFQGDQYLRESLGGRAKIKVYERDGVLQSELIDEQGEVKWQLPLEGMKGKWGSITKLTEVEGDGYRLQADRIEDQREIKVYVDLTEITREQLSTVVTLYNESKSPLLIQLVLTNEQKDSLGQVGAEQLVAIKKDKEVPVIVQLGTYLNDKKSYYLILVVRDTQPVIGEPGKIVKKRLDLYTP